MAHSNAAAPVPLLQLESVLKAYGRRAALRGVTLAVPRGARMALLGPNGAGKTTLLRVAAGLARPTAGRLLFEGSPERAAERVRPHVGFVGHRTLLYDGLSGRQNLEFFGRLYGVARAGDRAARLLEEFGLGAHAERPVSSLSRGMQQRLALARALVHRPSLLLLDEPYTGLDAAGTRLLTETLHALAAGGATVVVATHAVHDVLELADRLAILADGELRHAGPREALSRDEVAALYARAVGGAA
ncbi:MAG: heme ABC exporter ATP-binding protein CcmA [Gemmatimonadota bacterium]